MTQSASPQRILEAMARLGMAPTGDPQTFLAPRVVKRILDPSVVVVLGPRGSGKSSLAAYLTQSPSDYETTLRRAARQDWPSVSLYVDAFSQYGTRHPDAIILDHFVATASDEALRGYWLGWFSVQISQIFSPPLFGRMTGEARESWSELVSLGRSRPAEFVRFVLAQRDIIVESIDEINRLCVESPAHPNLVGIYDDLDTIGSLDPTLRARFIRALLGLWTSFSTRYQHLRAKIFLPTDLFDLRTFDTVDASKLMARAERLEWDVTSLYRLVLRHLGAQGEDIRAWLAQFGVVFREIEGEGWMPDEPDEVTIKRWLTATLRAVVAVNGTRSAVQQWIPNRLRDGRDRVAPRSMLRFFRDSARRALATPPRSNRNRLLTIEDAVSALEEVGEGRIEEIREVYEWVDRLLRLRGQLMPRPRPEIELLLEQDAPDAPRATRPRDGRTVTTELIRLGMLRELPGEMLDLPDLFAGYVRILRRPADPEPQSGAAQ